MPYLSTAGYATRRAGTLTLTPEEEDSLIRQAARAGISGLGMIGNLLDVPGSMIRDALTWLPGGPAPVNPFDQLLSPLSPQNRTSGRELLEGYGLRRNAETGIGGWLSDPGEGVRDVAGFAAEVLTDPLTFLTGGAAAIGRGAKALKAGGFMDDVVKVASQKAKVPLGRIGPRQARLTTTVDDMVAYGGQEAFNRVQQLAKQRGVPVDDILQEPIGALAAVKWTDTLLGNGPKAVKVAQWLDKWSPNPFELGSVWAKSTPGRLASALFSAPTMGRITKEVQPYAQELFHRETKANQRALGEALDWAEELARRNLLSSDDALLLRQVGEGVLPDTADPSGVAVAMRDALQASRQAKLALGRRVDPLEDEAIEHYITRFSDVTNPQEKPRLPMGSRTKMDVGRLEVLKGNLGGTAGTEELLTDPLIDQFIRSQQTAGMKHKDIVEGVIPLIKQRHGSKLIPQYRARSETGNYLFEGGIELSPAKVRQGTWLPDGRWQLLDNNGNVVQTLNPVMKERIPELADILVSKPEWREKGLFNRHPILDVRDRLATDYRQMQADDVFYDFAAAYAHGGSTGKTFGEMARERGLDADIAADLLAKRRGVDISKLPQHVRKDALKAFRQLRIDEDLANDYLKPFAKFETPDAMQPVFKAWDSFTNLFKAGVLTWPARYVRDLMSGQARNVEAGVFDGKSFFDAHRLLHGQSIAGAERIPAVSQYLNARGLPVNEKTASDAVRHLYAQLGPGRLSELEDLDFPDYSRGIEELLDLLPGRKPSTVAQNVRDVINTGLARTPETTWNPLDIRGVGDRTETTFGPVKAGERVARYTDDMNRLVPFLNQLKKGVDPAEAMRRIEAMQVNYDPRTFTPTERALKRLLPFYSFSSRQIKYVGQTLTQNPAGGMGQTIRALRSGRDDDVMIPEHISDTAAIPLPARVDDGTKRYLTGFGLMLEDPLSLLGGPRQAGLELLSRMNPLVKGPLEWATGQTFFQKSPRGGRPLDDLDPTVGRILANVMGEKRAVQTPQWLEAILYNSPITRGLTSLRQLTDTRKSWLDKAVGLGTGIRVTDVSPAAQEAMLREWLQDAEKQLGAKTFAKTWIPDDVKAKMEPQELANAIKMETLMHVLSKRAKERRERSERTARR